MAEDNETVEEWQAEAGKWKELAAKHERAAAETAGAVERLAALETSQQRRDDEHAQQLLSAATQFESEKEAVRQEGQKSIDEWRAEAEKWKQQASEHEKAAKENSGAADRLAQVDRSTARLEAEHAQQLAATAAKLEAEKQSLRQQGDKTSADWKSEAEKWKSVAREYEGISKKNLAAAARLEKLEAEGAAATKKAAETAADLQAKATSAEAKALRFQVAQEMGVPKDLIDLLDGTSKKEVEDSADKLLVILSRNKAEPEPEAVDDESAAKETAELAEARKLLAQAELKATRLEVAAERELPPSVAELLTATTREDLLRQADALLKAIGPTKTEVSTRARMPTQRLRSGALPEGAEPEPDGADVAEKVWRRNRGY